MYERGELVQWNDVRGFGFIQVANGARYFLHISQIQNAKRRPHLGDVVQFVPAKGKDGRTQATYASLLDEQSRWHVTPETAARAGDMRYVIALIVAGMLALNIISGILPLWVLGLYGGLGIISFISYAYDKTAAETGRWRISEAQLLWGDFLGGVIGGLIAQAWFRHKTRKPSYVFLTVGIVGLHLCLLVALATGVIDFGALLSPFNGY